MASDWRAMASDWQAMVVKTLRFLFLLRALYLVDTALRHHSMNEQVKLRTRRNGQ